VKRMKYERKLSRRGRFVCASCGWICDSELCWCGEYIRNHGWDGHGPVPMGCTCGYHDAEKRRRK
jgi:hypothetical protein